MFCLEASWALDGKDLTDACSVEQQLRMLKGAGQMGPVIHRDVATGAEFQAYMKVVAQSQGSREVPLGLHGLPWLPWRVLGR